MKRKLLMLTALALCLALLCGCTTIATSEWMQNLFPVGDEAVAAQQTGSVNGSEDKQEVKQVVTETYTALESFGLAYQPDYGLQPYNCQSLNNRIIFSFLYEPLFAVTSSYEAEPILAESYFVTDDGRTTTVKLRSGVTFHDGSALTAADAAYSIESAAGSEYYGSRLRFITSAEAQDDLTLVLSTSEAYECLPLLLDIPVIKDGSRDEAVPLGSGPYVMDGDTRLVRNTNWWQTAAPIVDFAEVKGQFRAKRAMEVAAAGGHNILLIGPPGSGKSMLAKRLPTILPPMHREEAREFRRLRGLPQRLRAVGRAASDHAVHRLQHHQQGLLQLRSARRHHLRHRPRPPCN